MGLPVMKPDARINGMNVKDATQRSNMRGDIVKTAAKFSRMLQLCAWCTKLIGILKTEPGRCDLSHGICQDCITTHFSARSNERNRPA